MQNTSQGVKIEEGSNPTPPIYIDNKEIDLADPSAWVQWQNYFSVNQPYTLRLWGRKFSNGEMSINEYQPIKEQRKLWRAEINNLETP